MLSCTSILYYLRKVSIIFKKKNQTRYKKIYTNLREGDQMLSKKIVKFIVKSKVGENTEVWTSNAFHISKKNKNRKTKKYKREKEE